MPQRGSGEFILLLGGAVLVEWSALLCCCISATCPYFQQHVHISFISVLSEGLLM